MEEGVFIEEGPPDQVLDTPKNALTRVFLDRFLKERPHAATAPSDERPPLVPPVGHAV
jgi:ABC-type glutathione transport system ATPase component